MHINAIKLPEVSCYSIYYLFEVCFTVSYYMISILPAAMVVMVIAQSVRTTSFYGHDQ